MALHGIDGVMVGRGAIADPYFFSKTGESGTFPTATGDRKVAFLLEHVRLHEQVWRNERNYEILKK